MTHPSIAPLPILEWPHPSLRTPARAVTRFDDALAQRVAEMWSTMYHARGVGLAAPQIGDERQIFVMDCARSGDVDEAAHKLVCINPELTHLRGQVESSEGCLSFPGLQITVPRAAQLTLRAQDLTGAWFEVELNGLEAICAQHECDHLSGRSFLDLLDLSERYTALSRYIESLNHVNESTAYEARGLAVAMLVKLERELFASSSTDPTHTDHPPQKTPISDLLCDDALPQAPRILFMGTPDFAVPALRALHAWCQARGGEVVGVVSQPDRPKGRGRKLTRTPVAAVADELGLGCHQWPKLNQESYDTLRALRYDLAIVIAYGKILPKRYLALPPWGCVNLHASLLPAYRGAAPIQWALIDGARETGVSVMRLDEGMDTGPVAHTLSLEIDRAATSADLFGALSELSARALTETLDRWADPTAPPIVFQEQPEEGASHARMLNKADGELDWSRPAQELFNRLRGVTPWPGGQAQTAEGTLKIHQAQVWAEDEVQTYISAEQLTHPEIVKGTFGVILAITAKGPVIRCASGALLLTQVQRPSKKSTSGGDFCRGYELRIGYPLGSC